MGFHQTVRSLSGTNGFIEVGTGRLDIVDQAGDDYTYGNGAGTATIVTTDSVFDPKLGTVYKSGAGTLTLKTPSSNFNGTFIMENGTLRLSNNQVFGTASGTGRLVVKGGQLARNDTPTSNYTYSVFAVDLHVFRYDLSDDAARTSQFAATTVTTLKEDEVEINITNTGVQTGTSGRFNFPGVIRNHDPIAPGENTNAIRGIRKTGNGVLALIGDATHANTYLGPTTIEDGVLLTSFISTIGSYSQATIAPINLKGGILASADRRVDPNTSVSYPIKNPINVEGNGTIAFFGSGSQTAGVLMELDNNSIVGTSGTLTIANLNVHGSASSTFQPRFTGNGFNFGLPIVISSAVTVGTGVKTSELQSGNTTGTQTFSGVMSGGGSLRRVNAGGETILSGANTYTGGTIVDDGTLTVTGSAATFGGGNVTVNGGHAAIASGVSNAIANAATLTLLGGGTPSVADVGYIDLAAGINEQVVSLVLGTTTYNSGTFGATGSGAANIFDEYFSGMGIITVAPAGLPGDFNSDGKVDAGDYVTWRKNNGTNNALANDNGLGTPVGQGHFDLWRANFGNPPGAGSSGGSLNGSGAVPEPASLALVIGAMLALFTCGGRRRAS
jgi:autotransporter-associated beta strand protein